MTLAQLMINKYVKLV